MLFLSFMREFYGQIEYFSETNISKILKLLHFLVLNNVFLIQLKS